MIKHGAAKHFALLNKRGKYLLPASEKLVDSGNEFYTGVKMEQLSGQERVQEKGKH